MFNLAILTGRLTTDAELKTTPNGISVTSFTLAVNRNYRAGEEQETDFINIVAWRQTAEFITKYFRKGNLIGIEGSIQTRKYTDKNGNNRTAFEVIANEVHFIESKRNNDNNESQSFSNADTGDFAEVDSDDDLPF